MPMLTVVLALQAGMALTSFAFAVVFAGLAWFTARTRYVPFGGAPLPEGCAVTVTAAGLAAMAVVCAVAFVVNLFA